MHILLRFLRSLRVYRVSFLERLAFVRSALLGRQMRRLLFPCLQRSFQSSTIFTRRINALPRQSTILRITLLCRWTARFFLHGICRRRKSVYKRRCSIKSARKSAVFAASLHTEFFQRTDVPLQFIKLSFFLPLECGERA